MIDFIGDLYLDKAYDIDFELDDFVANLEYPITKKGKPSIGKVNLRQSKSYLEDTFGKFPIAVCLANNHIFDYGVEGFNNTVEFLEKNNILYFGAGTKKDNFNNPCILNKNSKNIALFGYCCESTSGIFGDESKLGSARIDENAILNDIKSIKDKVDLIVVQLHWGDEEIKYPKVCDINRAKRIIDFGADVIIGHHAHVVQSVIEYKEKMIFFGIGNFIFPDLKVASFHNGTQFTSEYEKVQNLANKKSLVVSLDTQLRLGYKTVLFDGMKVIEYSFAVPKWLPKKESHYMIYYRLWTKYRMLELFFRNPRIPSVRQVKLFIGLK